MINFSGRVIVDKNLKSVKNTDVPELVQKTKEIVEHPVLGEMFGDVVFTNLQKKGASGLLIKYDGVDMEIVTKGKITPGSVITQLLIYICYKNNIPWYKNTSKGRVEFFKKLVDEHFANK